MYKAEDKVKIRTWEEMEEKFGIDCLGSIACIPCFTKKMEELVSKHNRILTISNVNVIGTYETEECCPYLFSDHMISHKVEEEEPMEFPTFEVGDRAFSYRRQKWGNVERGSIAGGIGYPLTVVFDNNIRTYYTKDGKVRVVDAVPDLFYDEVSITPPPKPKSKPKIPKDTNMIVWDEGTEEKERRHFSHWKNGKVACFANGETSWSSNGRVIEWDHYEIVEDTNV